MILFEKRTESYKRLFASSYSNSFSKSVNRIVFTRSIMYYCKKTQFLNKIWSSDAIYNYMMKCYEYILFLQSSNDYFGLFQSQYPQTKLCIFRMSIIPLFDDISRKRIMQFSIKNCIYASLSLDRRSILIIQ